MSNFPNESNVPDFIHSLRMGLNNAKQSIDFVLLTLSENSDKVKFPDEVMSDLIQAKTSIEIVLMGEE